MVSALTLVLIGGVTIIVGALVYRLFQPVETPFDPRAVETARITLPAEETVTATGAAGATLILSTRDAGGAERLRLFDAGDGREIKTVEIERR